MQKGFLTLSERSESKGFAPILIVIIIAALIGGYLIFQNYQLKNNPTYNCGGFMGTQCPSGYKCMILGGDSGTCVKDFWTFLR